MSKILIVDDEPNIVKLLTSRLIAEGYVVVSAVDGETALEMVRQEEPDLIILDITLPKMNGYEVCVAIRTDEKYQDMPIVMLTARKETREIAKGMELGAVAYVQKPFKSETLLAIIQGFLNE